MGVRRVEPAPAGAARYGGVRPAVATPDVAVAPGVEGAIFDALVAAVASIPAVASAEWLVQEPASGYLPPSYPCVVAIRRGVRPSNPTSTSELMTIGATLRVYVAGPDERSRGLLLLTIEGALRDRLVGSSFGGIASPHLSDFGGARATSLPEGGQEDIRVWEYDYSVVTMRALPGGA